MEVAHFSLQCVVTHALHAIASVDKVQGRKFAFALGKHLNLARFAQSEGETAVGSACGHKVGECRRLILLSCASYKTEPQLHSGLSRMCMGWS